MEEKGYRAKQGYRAVLTGLIFNIILAVVKTGIGIIGHSPALLADGINSTSDVAYYLVVGVFVRLANKPADEEHPYGHSRLESIGALVVGSFVITTAIAIFWTSVDSIFDLISGVAEFERGSLSTLIVAVSVVIVKIFLTFYTRGIAGKTRNPAINALANDHLNDIFSALAVTAGIVMRRFGYLWVDPLAGAIVALVILWTGFVILRESAYDLMETVPGKLLQAKIKNLLDLVPEVKRIDEIHAHRQGPYLVINITVCVDGSITVVEGDRIATLVEDILLKSMDLIRTVHVHYHPLSEDSSG